MMSNEKAWDQQTNNVSPGNSPYKTPPVNASGRSTRSSENESSTASNDMFPSSSNKSGWFCVVCCQKVPGPCRGELYAIGPCDHPICAECSTKMRVLCDQDECPICRGDIGKVMFTSKRDQKYASFKFDPKNGRFNRDYQIYFENEEAEKMFSSLLLHPCRICLSRHHRKGDQNKDPGGASGTPPVFEFATLKELDAHLRREHELFLCDLCVENLKVFSKERKYYSRRDLVRHRKTGDPDDTSHRGHPLCKFCDVRYMDDEDLHRHLRKDHYYCHFCDPLGLHQFYDSYDNMRDHFRAHHFLCEEGPCREERFTSVFRSDIDIQSHRAVNHCSTRSEAKEARILNIDFSLRPRGPGAGFAPQISASFQHQSRLGRTATMGSNLLGAVGGADNVIDSDDREALLQQELPRPEDFPSLAVGVPSEAGQEIEKPLLKEGKVSTPCYSELAEKAKNCTVKIPASLKKKNQQPSFSTRIGSLSSHLEEDFPALPGFSCPVPVGSLAPSKKELKNASKYATLSSVAAAVTSGVPKVVSKVATATCLPSNSSATNMLCSSSNSKTMSTQSLLSASSTSTVVPSVKSAQEFPALPASESKKKSSGGNKAKGVSNPAFSESLTSNSKEGQRKPLDFASKVASSSSSSSKTAKNTETRSRLKSETSVASGSGVTGTAVSNKCIQPLKNENEFPSLPESIPPTTRISNNKTKKREAGHSKDSVTKSKTALASTSASSSNLNKNGNSCSSGSKQKAKSTSGQQDKLNAASKKAPPPPPNGVNSDRDHHHYSSGVKGGKGSDSKENNNSSSISLSSVAQVIMGSCGPSGSSAIQSKTSSQKHHVNARGQVMDENGNSCSNSTADGSRDKEENLVNEDSSGTVFNQRQTCRDGVNDRSNGSGNNKSTTSPSTSTSETFVPPTNFEARNQSLVQEVTSILHDHSKFSCFKKTSNDFRKGDISGDEYYKKSIDLFGRNNFAKIFSELVTLLPNVKKQNELLSAHEKYVKNSMSTGSVPKNSSNASRGEGGVWIINNSSFTDQGLLVCPTCQQVLAKKDGPEHMSIHTNNSRR